MTFTRRRWDAWCLAGALFLALGGAADALWLSGDWRRPPGFAAAILPLVLLRFRVPRDGYRVATIRRKARPLVAWVCVSLPLTLVAAILAPRNEAWWIYALAAAAHLAVTLALAHRADSPSIPEA